MSLNWPATVALIASVTLRPRLIVPHVSIRDLRQLDFVAMRNAGYDSAVFDKDNCLTLPLQDPLIPDLADAWAECKRAFGPGRVLVVSNSAGTQDDPAGIQAESVSHKLGVPVLTHSAKKPGWACVRDVQKFLGVGGNTVVIGDRLFTDVVLARRLAQRSQTTAVFVEPWEPREARLLRGVENSWLRLARRMTGLVDEEVALGVRVLKGWDGGEGVREWVRPWTPPPPPPDTRPPLRREMGAGEWEGK
ncbi:HAD phosphatase [Auricularia subglabra TFB-10046 SS5]|nr:HAD phosphatase [Auricularia subglabra TFB-10046 SS5]